MSLWFYYKIFAFEVAMKKEYLTATENKQCDARE